MNFERKCQNIKKNEKSHLSGSGRSDVDNIFFHLFDFAHFVRFLLLTIHFFILSIIWCIQTFRYRCVDVISPVHFQNFWLVVDEREWNFH